MIDRLIAPLQEKVKRYLWGNSDDWKRRLDIVSQIPGPPLRDVRLSPEWRLGKLVACVSARPNLRGLQPYCRRCGEKQWWLIAGCIECGVPYEDVPLGSDQ